MHRGRWAWWFLVFLGLGATVARGVELPPALAAAFRARGLEPEHLLLPESASPRRPQGVAVDPLPRSELVQAQIENLHWDAARQLLAVRWRQSDRRLPQLLMLRLRPEARTPERLAALTAVPTGMGTGAGPNRPAAASPGAALWRMRPGQPATLALERVGMRLRLPVICLEGGAAGEVVRLRTREGRILRGRITGPANLALEIAP
jgi:hypothetical protein